MSNSSICQRLQSIRKSMVTYVCLTFLRAFNYHHHTHATAVSFRNSDEHSIEDTHRFRKNLIKNIRTVHRIDSHCMRALVCVLSAHKLDGIVLRVPLCPFSAVHPLSPIHFPMCWLRPPNMNGCAVSGVSAPTSKVKPCELTECILNITHK